MKIKNLCVRETEAKLKLEIYNEEEKSGNPEAGKRERDWPTCKPQFAWLLARLLAICEHGASAHACKVGRKTNLSPVAIVRWGKSSWWRLLPGVLPLWRRGRRLNLQPFLRGTFVSRHGFAITVAIVVIIVVVFRIAFVVGDRWELLPRKRGGNFAEPTVQVVEVGSYLVIFVGE